MGGANQYQHSSSQRVYLTLIFVDESLASTKTCANTKFRVQCYYSYIYTRVQ